MNSFFRMHPSISVSFLLKMLLRRGCKCSAIHLTEKLPQLRRSAALSPGAAHAAVTPAHWRILVPPWLRCRCPWMGLWACRRQRAGARPCCSKWAWDAQSPPARPALGLCTHTPCKLLHALRGPKRKLG